ncbi:toxin HicA, partial [Mycobacterium kansasii]
QTGGSHIVLKMPWAGDPRVNIQDKGGKAKAYQVKQVLAAIDKLNAIEEGEGR